MRGQVELPALGLALVLLTMTTVLGVAVVQSVFVDAERPAMERQATVSLSEEFVSADAPLTNRANVLNATRLETVKKADLREMDAHPDDGAVLLEVAGEEIAATGSVTGGTTLERLVLLESVDERVLEPRFTQGRSITLPRRTDSATVSITTGAGTTIRGVSVNDRTVLRNESGLHGTYDLELSALETTRFEFDATGQLQEGDVNITYRPPRVERATLRVTVNA